MRLDRDAETSTFQRGLLRWPESHGEQKGLADSLRLSQDSKAPWHMLQGHIGPGSHNSNTELLHDLAIPLWFILQRTESRDSKENLDTMFASALVTTAQRWG